MGRPCGQLVGCSVFASSASSQSIFAGSSGMLTLIAAWQAMEAAIRRPRASPRSPPVARCSGYCEHLLQHALQLAAFQPDRRRLHRERARTEGLRFKTVALQFLAQSPQR